MSCRTYFDPLHKGITLNTKIPEEKMITELIDSSVFQRLRRIKQLGPASLTFHGAESSRFTHSIGVFYISKRALAYLAKQRKHLLEYKAVLYGASLLHDIGHGPLSHTSEEMFGLNHEFWSAKLIRENKEIRSILDSYDKTLANKIASLIEGKTSDIPLIIKKLISSQ